VSTTRRPAPVASVHAPSSPDGSPPFFIVGNDRSGTTMLRLVLDRSREVAVPPESMFLADFASVRRRGELADPREAARFLARVWEHPKVRLWRLPGGPPPLPPGLGHDEAYRFAVEAPFRAYARMHGKARWGDKTPAYLHLVDELLVVWPSARVVVLVRDGRDVALSVVGMPFGPNNVWAAARWWARGIRAGRAAEETYPGQVATFRYEDLVRDPATLVARACAHVGVSYEEGMLRIEDTDPAKIVEGQERWFAGIWSGINASTVGKWRSQMSERERSIFAAAAGRELEALGYDAGGAGSATAVAPLYLGHDAAMRAVNFVRLRLVEERGREVRWVLRRKLSRA
jgi:Sulfotransferase family